MKYHEMIKNYIFREFECGLTVEEAVELCLKSVRTVKQWDKGRELCICDGWENFVVRHDRQELPTGQRVTAQRVLIGAALVELGASNDSEVAYRILKYARVLKKMV